MKEYINNLTYGASPEIFKRANSLRREMTDAEKILWEKLRNKRFYGLKFRRQHPAGKFITDFYCHEKRFIIEVDGGIHNNVDVKEKDEGRTQELENFELHIVRFTNEDICRDLDNVLKRLKVLLLKEKDLG